jgi:transcriptional regulator with XRE-family HTH domain
MEKRPRAPRGTGRSPDVPQNGIAIREFRLLKRWSSTSLAAEIGISQPTLSNIEAERRPTTHEVMDQIADTLGVDRRSVRREKDPNAAEKEQDPTSLRDQAVA